MNENDPYWWLHEEPEKWWKRMELGEEMEIPHYMGTATTSGGCFGGVVTGTSTIPMNEELKRNLEQIEKNLQKLEEEQAKRKKPPKRKREPAYRFLKQKDIDKLMDKHFNAKKNSI